MTSQDAAVGLLRGRFVVAARLTWIALVTAALALWCVSLPAYYAAIQQPCAGVGCQLDGALTGADLRALHAAGIAPQTYATYTLVLFNAVSLVWVGVALVIFLRRAHDPAVLLIALILATANATAVNGPPTALALADHDWSLPVAIASFLSNAAFFVLFLLFPDGRFVPRWTAWVFGVAIATSTAGLLPPEVLPAGMASTLAASQAAVIVAGVGVAIFGQIYRYRRVSNWQQRQQTKWAVSGLIAAGLGLLVLNLAGAALGTSLPSEIVLNTVFPLVLLFIPVTIAIAILRSRLYDIDLIINRALVYGSLTAILATLYFASVALLQVVASQLTGQHGLPPVAVVASTLLIAALFTPLRRRVQRVIDRHFYRSRYDTAKTLTIFGDALRREVDLPALEDHLVSVIDETMRPAHVSLWLSPEGRSGRERYEGYSSFGDCA